MNPSELSPTLSCSDPRNPRPCAMGEPRVQTDCRRRCHFSVRHALAGERVSPVYRWFSRERAASYNRYDSEKPRFWHRQYRHHAVQFPGIGDHDLVFERRLASADHGYRHYLRRQSWHHDRRLVIRHHRYENEPFGLCLADACLWRGTEFSATTSLESLRCNSRRARVSVSRYRFHEGGLRKLSVGCRSARVCNGRYLRTSCLHRPRNSGDRRDAIQPCDAGADSGRSGHGPDYLRKRSGPGHWCKYWYNRHRSDRWSGCKYHWQASGRRPSPVQRGNGGDCPGADRAPALVSGCPVSPHVDRRR